MKLRKVAAFLITSSMILTACGASSKPSTTSAPTARQVIEVETTEAETEPPVPVPTEIRSLTLDDQTVIFGQCTVGDIVKLLQSDGWILTYGDLLEQTDYVVVGMAAPDGKSKLSISGKPHFDNEIIQESTQNHVATEIRWLDTPADTEPENPTESRVQLIGGVTFSPEHNLEDSYNSISKNLDYGYVKRETPNEYASFIYAYYDDSVFVTFRFDGDGTKLNLVSYELNYTPETIDYDELMENKYQSKYFQ